MLNESVFYAWVGLFVVICRDFIKSNQVNANTQMDSFFPFAEPMPEQTMLPFYQTFDCNPISTKTSMDKADSGLTYNIPAPRKRQRDSINDLDAFFPVSQKQKLSGFSSFLDQDIIFQLQQQQSEIDRFIAQHVSKTIIFVFQYPFFPLHALVVCSFFSLVCELNNILLTDGESEIGT